MIAQITGAVVQKILNALVVEAQGVGYKVYTTSDILQKTKTGKTITLLTHLAVREDSLDLYGFPLQEELLLFEKLLTVSGIGPKSALAILNLAPVSKLMQAISTGDAAYLTKVSGVGKKSAAKIILELKDGITEEFGSGGEEEMRGEKDALEALMSLGYNATDATHTLRHVKNKSGDTGAVVKEALKLLSRQS